MIWVVTGSKTGDNAQILAAAAAMGLPYEVRHVALLTGHETAKPRVAASLAHIDLKCSDALEPPWPSLVITIGRRLSLVALWIKRQSRGQTRIALFNAPKGHAKDFDLVVVPAHYRIEDSPRVCRIGLPLIAVDEAKLAAAAERFRDEIGGMGKPLHVLLLGGGTSHLRLDAHVARDIVERLRASFASSGSLYVSTSRRTPATAAAAIEALLGPGDRLYRWKAQDPANPYLGLIAHGDTFTVTGDSISMLTEVARLGKPLVIAALPRKWPGILPQPRDFRALHEQLRAGGHAAFLGETPRQPLGPPPDDTGNVALRLRQLAATA